LIVIVGPYHAYFFMSLPVSIILGLDYFFIVLFIPFIALKDVFFIFLIIFAMILGGH
jgi:hypothetical protein